MHAVAASFPPRRHVVVEDRPRLRAHEHLEAGSLGGVHTSGVVLGDNRVEPMRVGVGQVEHEPQIGVVPALALAVDEVIRRRQRDSVDVGRDGAEPGGELRRGIELVATRGEAKAAMALLARERERQEREREIALDPASIEQGGGTEERS